MINFRVRDLDKMVAQLRERGITVELDSEVYPNGRFARLSDPEGNPIQLWQPGGTDQVEVSPESPAVRSISYGDPFMERRPITVPVVVSPLAPREARSAPPTPLE